MSSIHIKYVCDPSASSMSIICSCHSDVIRHPSDTWHLRESSIIWMSDIGALKCRISYWISYCLRSPSMSTYFSLIFFIFLSQASDDIHLRPTRSVIYHPSSYRHLSDIRCQISETRWQSPDFDVQDFLDLTLRNSLVGHRPMV